MGQEQYFIRTGFPTFSLARLNALSCALKTQSVHANVPVRALKVQNETFCNTLAADES